MDQTTRSRSEREYIRSAFAVMSFTKAAVAGLLVLATSLGAIAAAEVSVRFTEGALHGFIVLRTLDGVQLAQGDLFQLARNGEIEGHLVLHFDDGSLFEEIVVFTQERVFTMKSYRQVLRGPAFPEDTEYSLERASGKYRVKTKDHEGGAETVIEGCLDLPPDVYNGMVLTVAKNLPEGGGETIHFVAFTPKPRLIQIEIVPANNHKVLVGKLEKNSVHYVFKPRLGIWLGLFATLLGRSPPDQHAWIVVDEVPAFVRFEGPLYTTGPVWRIQLTSPRWPD